MTVSARVSCECCCCVRASVLKEFLVLRASVLKDLRVTHFPPFEGDEGYGVSVLWLSVSCVRRRMLRILFHTVRLFLHIAAATYLSALRLHHFTSDTT